MPLTHKIIKEKKEYSEIPVIVNTQAGEQENEYKALALGADDFIAKPYNPKIVKRRIANIIEKNIFQKKNMKKQEKVETLKDLLMQ